MRPNHAFRPSISSAPCPSPRESTRRQPTATTCPPQHTAETPAAEQVAAVNDGGADARSWAGLAARLGGLALGGVAFARSGSKRKQETAK